ncbi:MAG: GNAT family N-acetyltransferase [Nitrospiraceae bacterium]
MNDIEQRLYPDDPRSIDATASLNVEAHVGWPTVKHGLDYEHLWPQWEVLLKADSVATFFQTPLWCVTWYRCYHDEFEPIMFTAKCEGRLVGIAPLARERATGRVVFAGDGMSDYRDFVCEDGWRRHILPSFLSRMVDIAPQGLVVVGQMQPDSPTKDIICQWASKQRSYHVIIRTHPCRRFRLESEEQLQELYKKKTIRQSFKFYRRSGVLQFRRVLDVEEWNRLKTIFFQQHCLRQAVAGRQISFEDPRKQAFYSGLFESVSPDIHFSALWFSERPIAFMFCLAYRGVLYYGAPSIDPLENKHSPGILHIIEAMTQCHKEGFREVDLTLGSSAFKERLASYSVELPTVYLYGRNPKFWQDSFRKWISDRAKIAVSKIGRSSDAWSSFKERLTAVRCEISRLFRVSPVRLAKLIFDRFSKLIYDCYVGQVFRLTREHLLEMSLVLSESEQVDFRCNRLEDFLALEGVDRYHLTTMLQEAVKRIGQGHVLHTILLNGRLAHYGWSHHPSAPIYLPETQTLLTLPPDSLALYDFYTTEAHRGRRLYPVNLCRIASSAFKSGVTSIYVVCEARNAASRRGIRSIGFVHCSTHTMRRVLGMKWQRIEDNSAVVLA